MAEVNLHFQLYDTWTPSTTANAESILFQVIQGGDATHNEQFTNMRGAGALPQTEKMVINKIKIQPDVILTKADVLILYYNALIEFKLSDFSYFKVPVMQCIDHAAWSGAPLEATIADTITIGPWGQGWELVNPISIPGAQPFKVRLIQGAALSGASRIKVILEGIYTLTTQG